MSHFAHRTARYVALGQGLLARISFERMLTMLLFAIIVVTSLTISYDPDSWWALRTGQWIWEHGEVWTRDPWSSTVLGNYWPNHSWLTQVLLYLAYLPAGLYGPVLLCAAVATLTWGILYRLGSAPVHYQVPILLLGLACHVIVWSIRPHLMTLLLLALTLLLIRARRLLLPPLVFLVWANLHGGVGLGGLTLLAATLAASLTEPRTLPRWISVTLLSAAATLLNPLGLGMWSFTLSKLTTAEALYIDEWLPPALNRPVSYPFFILVAIWAGALLLRWRAIFRRDDTERHFWVTALLLGAIYAVLGFRSIRHTPMFAVAALPLLLHPRVWPVPRASTAQAGWQRGLLHLVLIGLVVGGGALGVAATWAQPQSTAWRPLTPPIITTVQSCQGTLYNTFDMGGALLWFVPERPVFVDSRNDPYPTDLLFRAVIAEQHGTYDELFAQYDVRCALVPTHQKIYAALRANPAWIELYGDDKLAVFARLNSSP